MKKKLKILSTLIIITALSYSTQAQTGKESGSKYGKGEDSVSCVRNLSVYRQYAKNKDYTMAIEYWKPVFEECPKASKNIYIDGAKIYKKLLSSSNSPERKTELSDTLMLIYDRRIENFGDKGSVRGRQGADLLKYRRNDGIEYLKQGYGYLKESIEIQGFKSSKAVLPTMLSASITMYNQSAIEASQVIEDYMAVSKIIDHLISNKPADKRLKDLKASIDGNFVTEGPGECETLINYFTEEHKTKGEDVEFLKMLTSLLRQRECTGSELFFTASKDLHTLAPSSESALNIAAQARSKEKYTEAIDYYNQAIEMEEVLDKTADYHFGIAICQHKLNNKSQSRESALKAVSIRSGYGEPYILIGQLYAGSKDNCTSIELPNAIYWAAVDMFVKAKNIDPSIAERANKLISTYSKYYPNKEEAFFLDVTEGSSYRIGCWLNVTTNARF